MNKKIFAIIVIVCVVLAMMLVLTGCSKRQKEADPAPGAEAEAWVINAAASEENTWSPTVIEELREWQKECQPYAGGLYDGCSEYGEIIDITKAVNGVGMATTYLNFFEEAREVVIMPFDRYRREANAFAILLHLEELKNGELACQGYSIILDASDGTSSSPNAPATSYVLELPSAGYYMAACAVRNEYGDDDYSVLFWMPDELLDDLAVIVENLMTVDPAETTLRTAIKGLPEPTFIYDEEYGGDEADLADYADI